jgi:hypothetical protein
MSGFCIALSGNQRVGPRNNVPYDRCQTACDLHQTLQDMGPGTAIATMHFIVGSTWKFARARRVGHSVPFDPCSDNKVASRDSKMTLRASGKPCSSPIVSRPDLALLGGMKIIKVSPIRG